MSEEMRRLREKLVPLRYHQLTGDDLIRLIDEVASDMVAANPGPSPYDLSGPGKLGHPHSKLG